MTALMTIAGISLAALVTSFISGILGMAGGMILMGILVALMPVPAAMMLHGITQMAANGWRAWLWRSSVNWPVFRGNAYGALSAVVVFAAFQLVVSPPIVYLILGVTPFISALLPKDLALNVDKRGQPFVCGLVCTALQLLSGVSGPLLDVFFLRSSMDRRAVVATKAASQSLGHVLKIAYFGVLVASDRGALDGWLAAITVVLAVVGTTLSRSVLDGMTDAKFRQWSRWTVMVLGTVYLGRGVWSLLGA